MISYLTAQPSRDVIIAARQQATRELWAELQSEFDTYVSALVLQDEARALAKRILEAQR